MSVPGVSVQGALFGGGVSVWGSLCSGGFLSRCLSVQGVIVQVFTFQGPLSRGEVCLEGDPLPPDRMTDASKNITLPKTSFVGGKYNLTANPLRVRLGCTRLDLGRVI